MEDLNIPSRRRPQVRKRSRVIEKDYDSDDDNLGRKEGEDSLFAVAWEKAKEITIRSEILDEITPRSKRSNTSAIDTHGTKTETSPDESSPKVYGLQKFSTESKLNEEIDPLMAEYIESRLKELLGKDAQKNREVEDSDADPDTEDPWLVEARKGQGGSKSEDIETDPSKIYSAPAYLRAKVKQKATDVQDSATGTGGIILGGTGIAEVTLPEQIRKEAELMAQRAYQEVIAARKDNGDAAEMKGHQTSDVAMRRGGSYSSNFEYHNNEYFASQNANTSR